MRRWSTISFLKSVIYYTHVVSHTYLQVSLGKQHSVMQKKKETIDTGQLVVY